MSQSTHSPAPATVAQRLATRAVAVAAGALPAEVIHYAKRAVIDWHAALYPGLGMRAMQALDAALQDEIGVGPCRLADGRAATARAAALFHGTAAHAAELDDSFREAMYHPGAATIAAALAAAQTQATSGLDFLRAVVVGYEVSTRIGIAMGRSHYATWHNTGSIGSFGAAAACATVLRLDADAFAHALAIAATGTSGLQQAFRAETLAKPLHAGRAAELGLLAARLARAGLRSSLDIFEGDAGLGRAMSRDADWSNVDTTLGTDFHVTRLTFKNHVGCGHAFPAIDGALALQAEHGFAAGEIAAIHLGVYRDALEMAHHRDPVTPEQAKFSLRYLVATALVHGSVRLAAFEPARLEDPRTRALMATITESLDADIDAGFPARRAARIAVRLHDGRTFVRLQPDRKGDPELPLSGEDLSGKLRELATPKIGAAAAERLLTRLWSLDRSEAVD